ncbi:hypothetical protein BC830DRAFT_1166009 [Chytriomyces sp. MP71]|nr:hypothetical protein BC830DRAFT_1166009 [Chytriomyces sp. MP71]
MGFVEFVSGITTLTLCCNLQKTFCIVAAPPFILQHPEVSILHPTRLECSPDCVGRDASSLTVTGIVIIIGAAAIIFVSITHTSIYFELVPNKDMLEISDQPRENASHQDSSFLHIDCGQDPARLSQVADAQRLRKAAYTNSAKYCLFDDGRLGSFLDAESMQQGSLYLWIRGIALNEALNPTAVV